MKPEKQSLQIVLLNFLVTFCVNTKWIHVAGERKRDRQTETETEGNRETERQGETET